MRHLWIYKNGARRRRARTEELREVGKGHRAQDCLVCGCAYVTGHTGICAHCTEYVRTSEQARCPPAHKGKMMIEYKTGDILAESVEALVNPVNCVGVMGAGLARRFKKEWPENFSAYVASCKRGEVQPGRVFVFDTARPVPPWYIVNFPTKRHWREKSRIEDIHAGLEALVGEIYRRNIRSIAVPALGAGLGGLPWPDVRAAIERALGDFSGVTVVVFEPAAAVAKTRSTPEQGGRG